MDERIKKLAKVLVHHSCRVQPGEKVWINYVGYDTKQLAKQLIKEVYEAGGVPFPQFVDDQIEREMLLGCTKEQLMLMAEIDGAKMAKMDCFIGIRGGNNASEKADVPAEKMNLYEQYYGNPVHGDIRVPKTKWVVLRYPNAAMAQLSGTSQDAFEDFYYDVCTLDYSKMANAMDSLVKYMERTDKVRLTGPGTDLTFSIKGIPVIPCAGECNIPDGEVYTAPVRESINGTLAYNTPSSFQGFTYENIRLEFKDGKIINAAANDTGRINKVFDIDEGARYVGEFAIGVNPYVLHPMKDTLFDEKIQGSIHFTPGRCYDDAYNGNHSAIHWDLVLIQRPEYGGGEMYFDDVLVRKDGRFVVPELECLNPENLK